MPKQPTHTERVHNHADQLLETARKQLKGAFGPASDGAKPPKPKKASR